MFNYVFYMPSYLHVYRIRADLSMLISVVLYSAKYTRPSSRSEVGRSGEHLLCIAAGMLSSESSLVAYAYCHAYTLFECFLA